jgi:tetratricopeptide (TPR) repeat protein
LGEFYFHTGETNRALERYQAALELKDWKPWVTSPSILEHSLYTFPMVLHALNFDDQAEGFFARMLSQAEENSQQAVLFRARGIYHAKCGKWAEAISDLGNAVAANPLRNCGPSLRARVCRRRC